MATAYNDESLPVVKAVSPVDLDPEPRNWKNLLFGSYSYR